MTDKKDKALKLALGYLDGTLVTQHITGYDRKRHVIESIREALAEQQEPYGWKVLGVSSLFMGEFAEHEAKSEARRIGGNSFAFPLYTSPPASKPWVGLTDEERGQVYAGWRFNGSNSSNLELCRAIEAKLKEKNNG